MVIRKLSSALKYTATACALFSLVFVFTSLSVYADDRPVLYTDPANCPPCRDLESLYGSLLNKYVRVVTPFDANGNFNPEYQQNRSGSIPALSNGQSPFTFFAQKAMEEGQARIQPPVQRPAGPTAADILILRAQLEALRAQGAPLINPPAVDSAEAMRNQLLRLRGQSVVNPSAPRVPVDITNAEYQKGAVAMLEMKNSQNIGTGLGAGTVVGCSPSNSRPGQYACFIVTAAHVLATHDARGVETYPPDITMRANFYVDNEKIIKNMPVTMIGVDKKNDVALGLIYLNNPLPSLPLAPINYVPAVGERVIGLGCPAGSPPREYTGSRAGVVGVEDGRIMTNCIPYPADSGGPLLSRTTCMVIGSCTGFESVEGGRGIFPQTRYIYELLANSNYKNEVFINPNGFMTNKNGLALPKQK